MRFFKINLRIKSIDRKIKNTNPSCRKSCIIKHITIDIHTVKQVIHENNFKKNFILKSSVKEYFTKIYSM
jgi:hypothetical protein